MKDFTVEVVTAPVIGDAWSTLRGVTDIIPGTILLEDPGEPMLVIPVEAETLREAALFVQGVMSVLEVEIKWGRAYLAEPVHTAATDDASPNVVPTFAPSWLEDTATTERKRELLRA